MWKDTSTSSSFGPPPGVVWVVRDIQVYNGNTLTAGLAWFLVDAVTLTEMVRHDWNIGDSGSFQWQGRLVVANPDSLVWGTAGVVGSTGCDVYIGGYTLNA